MFCKSIEETEKVAKNFVKRLKPRKQATVFGLRGDLGSGKTTFVKSVLVKLGYNGRVTSPTFVVQKRYKVSRIFKQVIHIDAYRLGGTTDLVVLDFLEEVKKPENLIFIEWPEIVESGLPKNTKIIDFKFVNENTREISFL
jgi:tRNA threonylcarbamoyladenosine biosynthesis protein TsaE